MADVNWIEELAFNAPDSERAFLKEVLCFLKRCPIFLKRKENSSPNSEEQYGQVSIGMKVN